jgi:hypothetical protein
MSHETQGIGEILAVGPIAAAALRYRGEIYTGLMHCLASEALQSAHPEVEEGSPEVESGFVTTDGQFVSRTAALAIAKTNGQRKKSDHPYANGTIFPITAHEIEFRAKK